MAQKSFSVLQFHSNSLWTQFGEYPSELAAREAIHRYIGEHPPLPNNDANRAVQRAGFKIAVDVKDFVPLTQAEEDAWRERGE